MPSVTAQHDFAMSVDELWSYLGDFGDIGKWSGRPKDACVQQGEGVGALRTLTIADGRIIVDKLEAVTEYSYSYSVVSGPIPYASYYATMSVAPLDDKSSRFTWHGEFEPQGMTDEECVKFTENVYAMGIGMMKDNIPVIQ